MQKILIITSLILVSLAAQAHEIDFSVGPQPPTIVSSDLALKDGRLVKAPWMLSNITVNNHSEHDIQVYDLMTTCSGASEFYNKTITFNQTVPMGQVIVLEEYLDALPESKSTIYTCTAILTWRGPHHAHHNTFEFQTQ